jgi:hypothetical protein
MTKTQHELLARANQNPQGIVAVQSGVITSRKQKTYGTRERNAAHTLQALGLLQHIRTHRGVHQLCHRVGADCYTEAVFAITEKGRRAAKDADIKQTLDSYSEFMEQMV